MEEKTTETHRKEAAEVMIVTSRKGGVGKSTLSTQTGAALAERKDIRKVLLIDCDFGVRCLDLLCGVTDKVLFDLGDIAKGRANHEKAVVNVTENLGMIASPISEKPDEEELVRLLGELIYGEYGTIILDTPRDSLVNVTRAAVKVTAEAKSKLTAAVVMHPHEMALRAAEITAGELIELGIAEDARKLVINSFEADEVLKGNRPGITELIDRATVPLLGIVPYDPDITKAQNDGRLLGDLKNKNSAQAYRNIAGRIKGENIPLFTGFKMSQRERKKILMA